MNADQLLALYDRVADAPDAVARLRRFVLDLAVRGKLLEQDPADEPAAELLKRIAAEKARLVKAGEIRRAKTLDVIEEDDEPFKLPVSWRWARLGDILTKLTDGTHHSPPNDVKGDFLYITAKNIKNNGISLEKVTYVSREVHEGIYARCNPEPGDVLYIKDGATTGVVTINDLDEPFSMLSSVALLKLPTSIFNRLIVEFLRSPFFYEQMRGFMKGAAITRVTLKRMGPALLPIPPLAEQHRIVAKVDELMALLDRLEAARTAREATRDRLTAAGLARLTAPDTTAEEFPAHARFALDALPSLTTRPDQIKTLRQTILNLAVRGKLVEQDPGDEPASELLKRIRNWKKQSISEKRIRAPRKPLGAISDEDQPYPCPMGWSFVRLGEIIYIQSGDGLTTSNMNEGPIPVFGGNGINGHHDQYNVVEPTIVIGRVGYYCGSIHVTPSQAWVTDNAFITHFSQGQIHLEFLALLLRATNLKVSENATAQPVISGSKIYPIVVCLPPLAEQQRIVAKVDALMALCDGLEAALAAADGTKQRLLEAVLHEALDAGGVREVEGVRV